jgi:SOS response regulatory protein OraA/RecX
MTHVNSLQNYNEKCKFVYEQLRKILNVFGETKVVDYCNFVKSACKEINKRSMREGVERVVEELKKKGVEKGLDAKILEEICKHLPFWCKVLYGEGMQLFKKFQKK